MRSRMASRRSWKLAFPADFPRAWAPEGDQANSPQGIPIGRGLGAAGQCEGSAQQEGIGAAFPFEGGDRAVPRMNAEVTGERH